MTNQLILPKAKVIHIKNYLSNETSKELYELALSLNWTNYVNRFDVKAHRLHWIGGKDYKFSNTKNISEELPDYLQELIDHINFDQSLNLNSIYANLYKNRLVALGYHSDDEKQLSKGSPVVSLSLGAPRHIWFKDKSSREEYSILLEDSDLLIMADNCQDEYLHAIKPDKNLDNGVRISLTFREFII